MSKKNNFDQFDSSDEEDIKTQNSKTSFRSNKDLTQISDEIGADLNTLKKSAFIHELARMIIYSPELEGKYRGLKERFLKDKRYLHNSGKKEINTKDLGIEVKNLKDLIAFGRFSKRSQMRRRNILKDKKGGLDKLDSSENRKKPGLKRKKSTNYSEERPEMKVTLSSKRNNSSAIVREDLAVSNYGLSATKFPHIDMVTLGDGGQDYSSAYRDSSKGYGDEKSNETTKTLRRADSFSSKETQQEAEKAANIIEKIQKELAAQYPTQNSDIFIADSIEKICKSEPLLTVKDEKTQVKLYSLTYLLFKTETFRSTAALVNNLQMLDLIKHGELTLKEAFVDQKMPMSAQGAVKAARQLQDHYNHIDPKNLKNTLFYNFNNSYKYSDVGEQQKREDARNLQDLVKSEANMLDKWLDLYFTKEEVQNINENFDDNKERIAKCFMNETASKFGLGSLRLNVIEKVEKKDSGIENSPSEEIKSKTAQPETPSLKVQKVSKPNLTPGPSSSSIGNKRAASKSPQHEHLNLPLSQENDGEVNPLNKTPGNSPVKQKNLPKKSFSLNRVSSSSSRNSPSPPPSQEGGVKTKDGDKPKDPSEFDTPEQNPEKPKPSIQNSGKAPRKAFSEEKGRKGRQ